MQNNVSACGGGVELTLMLECEGMCVNVPQG